MNKVSACLSQCLSEDCIDSIDYSAETTPKISSCEFNFARHCVVDCPIFGECGMEWQFA